MAFALVLLASNRAMGITGELSPRISQLEYVL